MRRIACAALALLALGVAALAQASLGPYVIQASPDGGARYVFDEVTVAVPASWLGKVEVLEYGDRAVFCQALGNRLWRESGGDEAGAELFTVGVGGAADLGGLADFDALGRTDRGDYYLAWPAEDGAFAGDAAAAAEYAAMRAEIGYVRENAFVQAFHAGPAPGALPGTPATQAPVPATQVRFSEADAPFDGVWVPFEDGFRLYIPGDWQTRALTDAQRAAGLFYFAGGGDGAPMGVAAGYIGAGTLDTVDALAADFERAGCAGVAALDLNGLPAIAFERAADDYRGVAFFHPTVPGYIMVVYVSPLAGSGATGDAILNSVSPR